MRGRISLILQQHNASWCSSINSTRSAAAAIAFSFTTTTAAERFSPQHSEFHSIAASSLRLKNQVLLPQDQALRVDFSAFARPPKAPQRHNKNPASQDCYPSGFYQVVASPEFHMTEFYALPRYGSLMLRSLQNPRSMSAGRILPLAPPVPALGT